MHYASVLPLWFFRWFRDAYLRVFERTKYRMRGSVAVQRLITVLYTLIKNERDYEVAVHRLRAKGVGGSEDPPTVTATSEDVAS